VAELGLLPEVLVPRTPMRTPGLLYLLKLLAPHHGPLNRSSFFLHTASKSSPARKADAGLAAKPRQKTEMHAPQVTDLMRTKSKA